MLLLGAGSSLVPQFNLIRGAFVTPTKTNTTAEEALKQWAVDTKNKPLLIPFLGQDTHAFVTNPAVREKIQVAIAQRNPQILTVAVVKNILMHDPKFSTNAWFLGCLIQVFNDNQFGDFENIPWTDPLAKIFRWDNRLENHMGHFSSYKTNKNETINYMINRVYLETSVHMLYVCKNIEFLVYSLRNFFNHHIAKKIVSR